MYPAREPEPRRPREIALSPAASSGRPGAGSASGGICLGGGGGFQPGNRPGSPPSHFSPGRGSRTCRRPLCCPPRPPERTAVSEGPTAPSGRPRFPPLLRGPKRAQQRSHWEATVRREVEKSPHMAHRTLGCWVPDGSDWRPLVPNPCISHPLHWHSKILRIYCPLPLGEDYGLQSFLFFCLFFWF